MSGPGSIEAHEPFVTRTGSMKATLLLFTASAVLMTGELNAQQPSNYYQTIVCLKVMPEKTAEFRQFVNDATKPVMQVRANAGEFLSWTYLRTVMPSGSEARCDYVFSTIYDGVPPAPAGLEPLAKT